MKTAITPAYTFNPGANTLDLSAISNFNISLLYGIINTTRGVLLFAQGSSTLTASVNNSVLTLTASTSGMSSSDKLMIIYESVAIGPGSIGLDYSGTTNRTSLPATVGTTIGTSTYGGSGPFAAYILVSSVPANTSRAYIDVENVTGATIVITRDDGTANAGSAPVNASWFVLAGGPSANAQGGSWSSNTFRGRVQCWAASATSQPTVMVD